MNETLGFCRFGTHILKCPQTFRPILTDEGICYTFNMLDANDLYREGYWKFYIASGLVLLDVLQGHYAVATT